MSKRSFFLVCATTCAALIALPALADEVPAPASEPPPVAPIEAPAPPDGTSTPSEPTTEPRRPLGEGGHPRHHRGHIPMGWFAPVGVNIGGAAHPTSPTGAVFGLEGSFVYFPIERGVWAGGYGDALYDTGNGRARFSLGPEIGWTIVGVDGGLLLQPGPKHVDVGYQVRGLLTFSVVSLYVRFGALPNAEETSFREMGVLLKIPIPVIDADR